MKVMFQYLYGGGGAIENMKVLYASLANMAGVSEIVVVCSSSSTLRDLGKHPKIRIVHFDVTHIQELNRLAFGVYGLRAIVFREMPDVIVSMNLGSYVPLPVPSVLCVNNPYQVYPGDVASYHPKGRMGVLVLRYFFRASLKWADSVVVQTRLMKQYVEEVMVRRVPVEVISKSVENERDVVATSLPEAMGHILSLAKASGDFLFLYVATSPLHKNHRVLIEAAAIARERGLRMRLLLSLSPEEIRKIGGVLGTSLLASGHILAIGWIAKPHLKAVYDVADACVMPSLLESLSSAHLEAMAWEKPQIVSDMPFARDLCKDAAVYCDATNPVAWADAMAELSADAPLRAQLVAEGRRVIGEMPPTIAHAAAMLQKVLVAAVNTGNSIR